MNAFGVIEDDIEAGVISLLGDELGYETLHGSDIAPDADEPERASWSDTVLLGRLVAAIARNPANAEIPETGLDDAVRQVTTFQTGNVLVDNRRLHRWLVNGVRVDCQTEHGVRGFDVQLIDWTDAEANDFLAVRQLTVVERRERRPDVVVYVNGLPLGVIELKSPTDDDATVKGAFNQLQAYKEDLPRMLAHNAVLVASDGWEARIGSLSADFDRFSPWRSIDGETHEPPSRAVMELPTLLRGVFDKERLLELIRDFTVFESDGAQVIKKVAQYHQFFGMRKALDSTIHATRPNADGRIGVVWHTQGSGKSLAMAYYAGMVMRHPLMRNPTIVVLTDRNDLDDQLFDTFAGCHEVVGEEPEQADSIEHLKEMLATRASGGVLFTTIQKFRPERGEQFPVLSERDNIVFIADEAHRSHTGLIDGFARHVRDALPNAAFIGFTGTPIESSDTNTAAVFGDYIDVYDIRRAVEDGATVGIYYEPRLAKLQLDDDERPRIDDEIEEVTEDEDPTDRERIKSRWARQEALVGADKRVDQVAQDIVQHFEQRIEVIEGKGMIVAMSRRIAVQLYDAITMLRPAWHDDDLDGGALKVVMSGAASDDEKLRPHIRSKAANKRLAARVRDPEDPLKLVIVIDMWLTGFDAPCLHTLYVDKPMRGHGLMQAIARVNRVFGAKPAGLVVDYLGIADNMKHAVKRYSDEGSSVADVDHLIDEAVAVVVEKHSVICDMLAGTGFERCRETAKGTWGDIVREPMDRIIAADDGERRFLAAVRDLVKAFVIAGTHDDVVAIRDDVAFFQLLQSGLIRTTVEGGKHKDELDGVIRQLVSRAVVADGVIDVLDVAGMDRPDLRILDDDFLADLRAMPQKNLALEALRRMLTEQVRRSARTNAIEARKFSELLEQAMNSYHSRAITMAELLEELIRIAKEFRERRERGEQMGLSVEELAFYDAVADNENARDVMGDEALANLAREIAATVKANSGVDWTTRRNVRAAMTVAVKELLAERGYPPDPDNWDTASRTVMEQAERVAARWSSADHFA